MVLERMSGAGVVVGARQSAFVVEEYELVLGCCARVRFFWASRATQNCALSYQSSRRSQRFAQEARTIGMETSTSSAMMQ